MNGIEQSPGKYLHVYGQLISDKSANAIQWIIIIINFISYLTPYTNLTQNRS